MSLPASEPPPAPALAAACRQFHLTAVIAGASAPPDPPCRWIALPEQQLTLSRPDVARLAALDSPPDALVRVIWSSGTTGGAKGSPIARTLQLRRVAARRLAYALGQRTRYLTVLPFSAPAYFMVLPVLAAGGTVVLPGPEPDLIALGNALRVTMTSLPPPLLAKLADAAGDLQHRLETVEWLDVIGAHLPGALAQALRLRLTANLRINYGATETAQVAAADSAVAVADAAAVAVPTPWAAAGTVAASAR